MPFPYYARLSPRRQELYRRSAALVQVPLPQAALLHDVVGLLRAALQADDRRAVEASAQALSDGLARLLAVPKVTVRVLAVRPSAGWGELHGLYTARSPDPTSGKPGGRVPAPPALIKVWMRTARWGRVVAFRTFLRTLLHEICHHLDFHLFGLEDSLHTEGFFKRENHLFHQLLPPGVDEQRS